MLSGKHEIDPKIEQLYCGHAVHGTEQMTCNCESSQYVYTPAGHVVTGNLRIIEDYKLRELIMKGPSHREQNNINWDLNMRLCKEAVVRYTKKWAYELSVDGSVLNDWKNVVLECIRKKIGELKRTIHMPTSLCT